MLKEEILSTDSSIETINLLNVTPFKWDVMYSFAPYTPKEMIYETVGYKSDHIYETVSEGMNQIVFLKDGKVVCYLYGYPENNGFGISFTDKKGADSSLSSVLTVDDDLTFEVIRRGDVIYLNKN